MWRVEPIPDANAIQVVLWSRGRSTVREVYEITPLWLSLLASRKVNDFDVIARLRPGVTVREAQSEMDAISRRLATAHPQSNANTKVQVVPLRDHLLGKNRRVLGLLTICTVCVLLLACGNVANLLLSIAAGRQKEVAIRSALGASTVRIALQFLVESTLIAFAAASLGGLFASWGILRNVI